MSQRPPTPPGPQPSPTPPDPQIEELRKEVRDLSERLVRIEERLNTQKEQVGRERAESTIDNFKWGIALIASVVMSLLALIVSVLIGTGVI